MTGYIHLESPLIRTLARRIDRAKMRLPAMNRMIAILLQDLDERSTYERIIRSIHLRHAIVIPIRQREHITRMVGHPVFLQRPIRDPMTRGVRPGNQAATRRRTDTARIGLREHHSLARQTLHVRRLEHLVIRSLLRPERHGRVLPSHIIHQKKNDIRTLRLFRGHTRYGRH